MPSPREWGERTTFYSLGALEYAFPAGRRKLKIMEVANPARNSKNSRSETSVALLTIPEKLKNKPARFNISHIHFYTCTIPFPAGLAKQAAPGDCINRGTRPRHHNLPIHTSKGTTCGPRAPPPHLRAGHAVHPPDTSAINKAKVTV